MRASFSRAVASLSKIENQTLVLMGAVSVRLHAKGNLGAEPHAEVIADLLRAPHTTDKLTNVRTAESNFIPKRSLPSVAAGVPRPKGTLTTSFILLYISLPK